MNRLTSRNDELFVHDGWQVVLTLDKTAKVKEKFLWGAKQDELLCENENFVLTDHLGTVRKVVDKDGKAVAELEYDAFGKLLSTTGQKSRFRYTGKLFDDETGLQWNINRWYDSNVGMWISEDPIGFEARDANLARYVLNDPLNRIDVQGLRSVAIVLWRYKDLDNAACNWTKVKGEMDRIYKACIDDHAECKKDALWVYEARVEETKAELEQEKVIGKIKNPEIKFPACGYYCRENLQLQLGVLAQGGSYGIGLHPVRIADYAGDKGYDLSLFWAVVLVHEVQEATFDLGVHQGTEYVDSPNPKYQGKLSPTGGVVEQFTHNFRINRCWRRWVVAEIAQNPVLRRSNHDTDDNILDEKSKQANQENKSHKKPTPKKDEQLHGERTPRKIINWVEYSDALVQRGNFTLWISDDVIEHWLHKNDEDKLGRPFTYSDLAFESFLTIREFFRTTSRATEGFGISLAKLLNADVAIPDFTSLAKRAAKLGIDIDVTKYHGKIDVVVDSTGLKVFGEGEWKVKKHGWVKHWTWRKLHLMIDPATHQIIAELLTGNDIHDSQVVKTLLDETKNDIERFYGDGH